MTLRWHRLRPCWVWRLNSPTRKNYWWCRRFRHYLCADPDHHARRGNWSSPLPANVPFQNGPTRGKDVFVPIDYIIGGPKMAGQGWRMLVECLSVGRGITLPSGSTLAA
ncbi:hypothetical protein ACLB1Q_15020 [Escherichia coli]